MFDSQPIRVNSQGAAGVLSPVTLKRIVSAATKTQPEQLQFIFGASVGVEAEQFLFVYTYDRLPKYMIVSLLLETIGCFTFRFVLSFAFVTKLLGRCDEIVFNALVTSIFECLCRINSKLRWSA